MLKTSAPEGRFGSIQLIHYWLLGHIAHRRALA
jgi:hypothetical protein